MISYILSWLNQIIEPDRLNISVAEKDVQLWYPEAIIERGQVNKGVYRFNYPEYAVIHYTGSRRSYKNMSIYTTGVEAMLQSINDKKYSYFVIGMDGTVIQSLPLNLWGYHAGTAYHPKLKTSNVSSRSVGIEVVNAGMLTKVGEKFKSWYGEEFDSSQVRYKDGEWYLKFTPQQENSLTSLLRWLANNNPSVFKLDNVVGHNEVSIGRKTDPGGCLSMSMNMYRDYLNDSH